MERMKATTLIAAVSMLASLCSAAVPAHFSDRAKELLADEVAVVPTEHPLNVVYFLGNDNKPVADYERRLSELMLYVQQYYAREMTRNGFPGRTFGLERLENGNVKLHVVRGKRSHRDYVYGHGHGPCLEELREYAEANPGAFKSDHILVIMPITGLISNGLVGIVGAVCMSESIFVRMIAGFLGSFLFLPLVAMGMHHGLVALYTVQLETIGFVTLYPALAMAGAGQVGAAIAIWLKARKVGNKRMMSVIGGALPAGVLGVGEPLIYGVTLPMGKPFITAGLGAGFGGAFCMAMKVAATTWGPSGVLALPIMVAGGTSATTQMLCYVVGLVISYIMGFIITNFTLKDADVANA